MSIQTAFEERISPEPNSGCWIWTGSMFADGRYGRMKVNGKTTYAHRLAHELYKGPIPHGLHIDHLCRNTSCVNPDHLEAVTCKENLMRGQTLAAHNAAKSHCLNGHEFDRRYTNGRACSKCSTIRMRHWRAAQRAA